jgi:hypothetical protein
MVFLFYGEGLVKKVRQAILCLSSIVLVCSVAVVAIHYLSFPAFDRPTQKFPSYGNARILGCLSETAYKISPDYFTLHSFGLAPNVQEEECGNSTDMGPVQVQNGFYLRTSSDMPAVLLAALLAAPRLQSHEQNRRNYLYRHVLSCESNPLCQRPDQYLIVISETKLLPDNITVEYYSRRVGLQLIERDGKVAEFREAEVYTKGYEFMEGKTLLWILAGLLSFTLALVTLIITGIFYLFRQASKRPHL